MVLQKSESEDEGEVSEEFKPSSDEQEDDASEDDEGDSDADVVERFVVERCPYMCMSCVLVCVRVCMLCMLVCMHACCVVCMCVCVCVCVCAHACIHACGMCMCAVYVKSDLIVLCTLQAEKAAMSACLPIHFSGRSRGLVALCRGFWGGGGDPH